MYIYQKDPKKGCIKNRVVGSSAIFILLFCLLGIEHAKFEKKEENITIETIKVTCRSSGIYESAYPVLQRGQQEQNIFRNRYAQICGLFGFQRYWNVKREVNEKKEQETEVTEQIAIQKLLEAENKEDSSEVPFEQEVPVEAEYVSSDADMIWREENDTVNLEKIVEPEVTLEKEEWIDPESFRKRFYTVDPTTQIQFEEGQIDRYLSMDMRLNQEKEGPKVLIYHTHSQEGFVDSVQGDPSTTIVGAGEYLTQLLRDKYGIEVIHETGEYDIDSRSTAYSNVLPVLERYREEYESLEVIIDLHRDELKEGKLLTEVQGKPTAKFMFFNGLSYLNEVGDIQYLYNPYKEQNLAFSFQLQYLAEQYYPGVARKIYLKGYRYNLHVMPKSLLVEMGAQSNTREEIWNACEVLADLLAKVLLGSE